ncbi:DnaD domain protein [Paenibacillus massiliensis]|uniref:DnaD domain protein n=1 Tax=Paenibacillus massiliensis TaxID=225917 RepID=UPI0004216BE0|nr:DnaD domain protein [Paenibacillus massiliensis]
MTETARPTLSGLLEQFEAIGGPEEFGPEGIAIMVALWMRSSKLGWRKTFKMTNTDLMLRTGFKNRDTLNRHRSKLVEGGLIGYIQPPRGSSKGDYILTFDLIAAEEVAENFDHFEGDNEKVVNEPAENFDNYTGVVGEVAQKSDNFLGNGEKVVKISDTVLDLSSTASTSTTSATAGGEEFAEEYGSTALAPYESFFTAHERIYGFSCNPHQSEVLGKYIDEDGMEEAVVIRALERSALISTSPSIRLTTRILNDYLGSKALTLDKAIAFDAAFDAKKASNPNTGPPPNRNATRQQQKLNRLEQLLKEEENRGKG